MTPDDVRALPLAEVRRELAQRTMQWASRRPMGHTSLPLAVLRLPDHDRLAWLLGQLETDR